MHWLLFRSWRTQSVARCGSFPLQVIYVADCNGRAVSVRAGTRYSFFGRVSVQGLETGLLVLETWILFQRGKCVICRAGSFAWLRLRYSPADGEESWFDSWQGKDNFFPSRILRPALGPTQACGQWVPKTLTGDKAAGACRCPHTSI